LEVGAISDGREEALELSLARRSITMLIVQEGLVVPRDEEHMREPSTLNLQPSEELLEVLR